MTAIEEQQRVCVWGGVGRIEGAAQGVCGGGEWDALKEQHRGGGWWWGGEWDALRNTSVINVIINLYI